jgi:FkbM family methyltransferase
LRKVIAILGFFQAIKVFYYWLLRKQLKVQHTYPVELYKAIQYVSVHNGNVTLGDKAVELNFSLQSKPLKVLIRKGASDAAVFHQIFAMAEYQCLVSLVNSFPGLKIKSIIDAGANVGYTSLFFLANFPEAHFVCIEPDDQNYKLLEQNIAANALASHVLLRKALWKNSGSVTLSDSFRDHREWSRQVVDSPDSNSKVSTQLEGIPLNELFRVADTESIDILKIDIEGAEKEVFSDYSGSIEVLKNVKFLIIELHDEVDFKSDFERLLIAAGFHFTYVGESLLGFNSNLFKS